MEAERPAEEPIIEPQIEESEESAEAVQVEEQPAPLVEIPEQPVLITGAAGLVGSHVCRELARRGWKMRALVRNPKKAAVRLAGVPVDVATGDIRDRDALRSATRGASAVVHLAAIALERLSPFVYPLPGGGTTRFQPVAVDDVARAVCVTLERSETIGGTYALGGL